MSYQNFNTGTAPATPAAGKLAVYTDSADRRVKAIDEKGIIASLTPWNTKENVNVNGGFDFAQRQTPGTLTTYSNTTGRSYGADRWGMTNENASMQYQRIDSSGAVETGLHARYYGKFKKITNAGKMVISQVSESANTAALRGRVVRVQALMKFSVAASMTVRLGCLYLTSAGTTDSMPATFVSAFGAVGTDPTWGTNITALAPTGLDGGTANGLGMDCVLTSAWVRYSAAFTLPASAKNIIPAIWTNGQPAINDELNITEWGLYDGAEIMDWTPRPYGQELALCQRYYTKSFAVDTGPAQNVGAAGSIRTGCLTAGAVANSVVGFIQHKQSQFLGATAVVTFYNPSAANAFARNVTRTNDATATSAVNGNNQGLHWNCTGVAASWIVGDDIIVHYSADAEL